MTNILSSLSHSIANLQQQQQPSSIDESLLYSYTLVSLETIGSICGSIWIINPNANGKETMDDGIQAQLEKTCQLTYEYLFLQDASRYILPTMLVGGYGEAFIQPALVFSAALVSHSSSSLHSKLAYSGILVPICDILRQSSFQNSTEAITPSNNPC